MLEKIKKYMQSLNNKSKYFEHRILKTNIFLEPNNEEDSIYFGCGCFWGAEKCFWKLPGVITTSVGYAGGSISNPSYNAVCSGLTGHAEVVKVVWNPMIINISDLLKMFWECHDPTQKDRQGNDYGSQYRSTIYYFNNKNETLIQNSRDAYQHLLTKNGFNKIKTEIKQINNYFYAENYHQQYLAVEGSRQYCSASPTNIKLDTFLGSNFMLDKKIWNNFDWTTEKCILRSSNNQIINS